MDLHEFNQLNGRRLEVVVDSLPQLAIDTTMVSQFEATKARRYPELSGEFLCSFATAKPVMLLLPWEAVFVRRGSAVGEAC